MQSIKGLQLEQKSRNTLAAATNKEWADIVKANPPGSTIRSQFLENHGITEFTDPLGYRYKMAQESETVNQIRRGDMAEKTYDQRERNQTSQIASRDQMLKWRGELQPGMKTKLDNENNLFATTLETAKTKLKILKDPKTKADPVAARQYKESLDEARKQMENRKAYLAAGVDEDGEPLTENTRKYLETRIANATREFNRIVDEGNKLPQGQQSGQGGGTDLKWNRGQWNTFIQQSKSKGFTTQQIHDYMVEHRWSSPGAKKLLGMR